jgi:hypothetical protein
MRFVERNGKKVQMKASSAVATSTSPLSIPRPRLMLLLLCVVSVIVLTIQVLSYQMLKAADTAAIPSTTSVSVPVVSSHDHKEVVAHGSSTCEFFHRWCPTTFPRTSSCSSIGWAHSVNSIDALNAIIKPTLTTLTTTTIPSTSTVVHMLEIDLRVELESGGGAHRVVLAHDALVPHQKYDSFEQWLLIVLLHNERAMYAVEPLSSSRQDSDSGTDNDEKITGVSSSEATIGKNGVMGIKLDFKDPRAVTLVCDILLRYLHRLHDIPVWLNADILAGPNGGASIFDGAVFLRDGLPFASRYQSCVWSLGWTTGAPSHAIPLPLPQTTLSTVESVISSSSPSPSSPSRVWYDVSSMLQLCRQYGIINVTFPLRLCYVPTDWTTVFEPLLSSLPYSTLTIWKGRTSMEASNEALQRQWITTNLPLQRTFIDLDY